MPGEMGVGELIFAAQPLLHDDENKRKKECEKENGEAGNTALLEGLDGLGCPGGLGCLGCPDGPGCPDGSDADAGIVWHEESGGERGGDPRHACAMPYRHTAADDPHHTYRHREGKGGEGGHPAPGLHAYRYGEGGGVARPLALGAES